jgi:hypothetical protein
MVTLGTTVVFGIGTALGTVSGARLVRREEHHPRLNP